MEAAERAMAEGSNTDSDDDEVLPNEKMADVSGDTEPLAGDGGGKKKEDDKPAANDVANWNGAALALPIKSANGDDADAKMADANANKRSQSSGRTGSSGSSGNSSSSGSSSDSDRDSDSSGDSYEGDIWWEDEDFDDLSPTAAMYKRFNKKKWHPAKNPQGWF